MYTVYCILYVWYGMSLHIAEKAHRACNDGLNPSLVQLRFVVLVGVVSLDVAIAFVVGGVIALHVAQHLLSLIASNEAAIYAHTCCFVFVCVSLSLSLSLSFSLYV